MQIRASHFGDDDYPKMRMGVQYERSLLTGWTSSHHVVMAAGDGGDLLLAGTRAMQVPHQIADFGGEAP